MNNLIALIDNAVGSKSKCESLVYIHAYISGASHVSRAFVPDIIDHKEAEQLLEVLFLSHPLQIAQKTHSRAKSYISGYIHDINSKNAILQDIEAVIESSFGSGKIVYEESRFTPYGRSIYDDAKHLVTLGSPKISNHALNRREKARKRAPHQKRHGTPCNPVERALRSSYEQKWALSWMTPSVYLVPGDSTKTVHTIWTQRFGDAS
jgi:hypothetical protein